MQIISEEIVKKLLNILASASKKKNESSDLGSICHLKYYLATYSLNLKRT